MIPTITFSIVLLNLFTKAGIKRRRGEKDDHHCNKDEIIHTILRYISSALCALHVGKMPRPPREALIKIPAEVVKKVLKFYRSNAGANQPGGWIFARGGGTERIPIFSKGKM
jgi:hypothetical protein